MRNFSRAELITNLTMMLCTVENNPDMEVRKTMALSMFEVTVSYYNLLTQGKGDKKLIQTCYDKAKGGGPKFAKYVVKFEELTRPPPPPLRRSARLLKN